MDKATVLVYMESQSLFGFEWLAEYLADVTNAFVREAPLLAGDLDPYAVQAVITEMAKRQKEGSMRRLGDDDVKELLFDQLDMRTGFTPEAAEKIPWPQKEESLSNSEITERLRQKHSAEIERFKLRSRDIQYSARLVNAAQGLQKWFHWVVSGPAEGTFFPKEKTSKGETNHFVEWIHGTGNEPNAEANMNCWQAVFFAAYKAGLVSIARLRAIHIKATMAGRAYGTYTHSLTESLGYQNSFPYVPSLGLIPRPGDVVFFDREEHVALCMESGFSIKVMSHWNYPRDGFRCYGLDQFTASKLCEVRFGCMPV